MAAAAAALLGTSSAAAREPYLHLALQGALSRYSGDGLPRECARGRRCAAGDSVAAHLGIRVVEGFDAHFALRKTWTDHPGVIYAPSGGVAWWPSQGVFSTRVYTAVGLVLAPGSVGFDAHLGGDLIVFPVKFLGLGLSGEIGPVGFFGGSTLRNSHVGAAIHLRF
jgi:hypothetical protein